MKHQLISFAFGATLSFCTLSYAYVSNPIILHNVLAEDGKQTVVSNQGGGLSVRVGNGAWQGTKGCTDGLQPGDPVRINNVKYIPDTKLFVAVGYKYGQNKATIYGENGLFCSSADGINWNAHMLFLNGEKDRYRNVSLNDIVYSNGTYVVVGQRESLALARQFKADSNDADKWIDIWGEASQPGTALNSITITPDNRLIVAGDNASIYTFSPAGTNNGYKTAASVEQLGGGGADFNQVIYINDSKNKGPTAYVAIANSATIWYSSDAVRWTQVPDKMGSANFNQIVYANKTFVIAADDGEIWYSTNGATWVEGHGVDSPVNLYRIIYADHYFQTLGIDEDGKEFTWYSMNGQNWSKERFPILYVENDGYYRLGQVCIKLAGNNTSQCEYLGYSFDYTVGIGDKLQPAGGLKKGDKVCVNANTGATGTNFYFNLTEDATEIENGIVVKLSGSVDYPAATAVLGVTDPTKDYSKSVCNLL